MDQESEGVMLCLFFKFQIYVDRVVLIAYYLLLNDDMCLVKAFFELPFSHPYVCSSRKVGASTSHL